jgi:CRP/FNR family transcriptional regulator, cyclic AMP receptor protein
VAKKTPAKAGKKAPTTAEVAISIEDLRHIPAFAGMSTADAAAFLSVMEERLSARGVPLFKEGETGEGLWVILEGRVSITKRNAKGGDREVAVLDRHEVFGEMDLISDRPHNSGARGQQACRLLFLPKKAFQDLLRRGNAGAASMVVYFARMLAGRLDANNKRMLELLDGKQASPGSSEFSDFKRRLLKDWSF